MKQAQAAKFSYFFLLGVLALVAIFKIATPFVTVLFSIFALRMFKFFDRKAVAVALFLIFVSAIFYGFYFFVNTSIKALPAIAEASIPKAIELAEGHGYKLPFSDLDGLKALAANSIRSELEGVAKFAELATKEFLFLIIGLVVAISIFINGTLDLNREQHAIKDNLYSAICSEVSTRFTDFYQSFHTVMGAQIIISTINTTCTGIFVYLTGLPYASIIVVITFLCGLLPIIGNLISNSVIVGIGLTVSPKAAFGALLFLVLLHKAEYFLNSRIIGGRIKNPMWLTLLGLLVGERVMGIPGMILAPILLHYVKQECLRVEMKNA